MKTPVALLTLILLHLTAADTSCQQAPEEGTKVLTGGPVCVCPGRDDHCQNAILREVEAKLRSTEKQLEDLRAEIRGPRVAFGAYIGGSGGHTGHFDTDVTLVYRNVHTNTGSYQPETGIFTAPIKGVYYFSFSGHHLSIKAMGLQLMKNGLMITTVYNHAAGSRHETATSGMTVQLEAGDQVYVRLMKTTWIFDNINQHSTFTGFLLFPLLD